MPSQSDRTFRHLLKIPFPVRLRETSGLLFGWKASQREKFKLAVFIQVRKNNNNPKQSFQRLTQTHKHSFQVNPHRSQHMQTNGVCARARARARALPSKVRYGAVRKKRKTRSSALSVVRLTAEHAGDTGTKQVKGKRNEQRAVATAKLSPSRRGLHECGTRNALHSHPPRALEGSLKEREGKKNSEGAFKTN